MIDYTDPIPVGTKVVWAQNSHLAGVEGVIIESGCVWSFVKVNGSDREEYTRTALLEIKQIGKSYGYQPVMLHPAMPVIPVLH